MDKKETFGAELAKQLPVKEIYTDLAQPMLSTTGQALQGITRVALAPVSALVWGYEKISAYLDIAIPEYFAKRKIDKEKITSPDPAVAVPIMEAMRYISHKDELRELFTTLLCSSMNLDTSQYVHSAYVEIAKQLESDEAKILKKLPPNINIPHPLINVRLQLGKSEGNGLLIIKWFSDIGFEICDRPANICKYLENLERLKLIEIPPFARLTSEKEYVRLFSLPSVQNALQTDLPTDSKYTYDKLLFKLTSFGTDFINSCTK